MFPHTIEPLDENTNKQLCKDFKGERTGFVKAGPLKTILPAVYKKHAEHYYNMPLKKDDVWVVTYPRSGTTLCQELVWLVNNNFDFDTALKSSLQIRFPFLEVGMLIHDEFSDELCKLNQNPKVIEMLKSWKTPGYELAATMKSPRHFKTHLPFSLLPPTLLQTCKVIYVARNAKDVAPSYFHHNRLVKLHDYIGDFPKYWNYFKNDLLVYSPYWGHLEEAWGLKNNPNLLFLFYEDVVTDMKGSVKKVADFLEKTVNENDVNKLCDHLQIDNFRKNVPVQTSEKIDGYVNDNEQGFIRNGKIGGNKEFDETLSKEVDEWIAANLKRNKIHPFPNSKP
uniref:Putative sulfotransferase n=1 Tax=Panstrongylus lignarius TaxID=156445 RepID=A0A224XS02_9HEMI